MEDYFLAIFHFIWNQCIYMSIVFVPSSSTVSGLHARIQKIEGGLLVTDLDSTNGTFIDDKKLRPGVAAPISPGSCITFGNISLLHPVYPLDFWSFEVNSIDGLGSLIELYSVMNVMN